MSNSTATGPSTVGIDAGASLCKVAMQNGSGLRTAMFGAADLDAVAACIDDWKPQKISATGGGASRLNGRFGGLPVQTFAEFEAWATGAPILARSAGLDLPEGHLLVSLGTGTSVLQGTTRVGGSALGGGTLVGLGKLLAGSGDFAELTALAERGDRRKVDLLVGDIYRGAAMPLHADVNAASFGKLESTEAPDLAAALMAMVGENVALICGALARQHDAPAVVYCGSTVRENPVLRATLEFATQISGVPTYFLDNGAFCGAIGAAALAGGVSDAAA